MFYNDPFLLRLFNYCYADLTNKEYTFVLLNILFNFLHGLSFRLREGEDKLFVYPPLFYNQIHNNKTITSNQLSLI